RRLPGCVDEELQGRPARGGAARRVCRAAGARHRGVPVRRGPHHPAGARPAPGSRHGAGARPAARRAQRPPLLPRARPPAAGRGSRRRPRPRRPLPSARQRPRPGDHRRKAPARQPDLRRVRLRRAGRLRGARARRRVTMTAAPRRDGALVASAAAVLYLLLLQDRFYGADGHVLLQMAVRGADVHERHLLYLPAARAALALLAPLGVTPFRALEVLSAVATALGVFVLHRTAARCGHPRAAAAVAAVGCAVLPVTLFFATTIEVHGLFFLPAALAWYAAARCAARPVAWTGCALGAACALAGCTHASGHAMLFLLVPVVALQRGVRAAVRPALAAGAVHAAFLAALSLARPRHGDAW